MNTEFICINDEKDFEKLTTPASCLHDGGLVVFPTETVYGLGANAFLEDSVRAIYAAKGRPSDNPLIVHIAEISMLPDIVREIPQKAYVLMEKLWPCALTLVMKKSGKLCEKVTAGLDTVAVRMPSNPVARELIKRSGVPVAAPSANLSGKPSPTEFEHVRDDMDGRVDYIIDGGACEVGLESTVLDLTEDIPKILRPGGISKEALEALIGTVLLDKGLVDKNITPKAPGMKYRHYAPKAEMFVLEGESENIKPVLDRLLLENKHRKTGVIAMSDTSCNADFIKSGGSTAEEYAHLLFHNLRELDKLGADVIFAEFPFSGCGIEPALQDRISKSCGGNIIKCK